MGASEFWTASKGKTAREAFASACDTARYEHGHTGYTGTIAEKSGFTVIRVPVGQVPAEFARKLLDDDDGRIVDKWGDAGCVKVAEGEWLFFGWASA